MVGFLVYHGSHIDWWCIFQSGKSRKSDFKTGVKSGLGRNI